MEVIQRGRTAVRPALFPPLSVVPAVSDSELSEAEYVHAQRTVFRESQTLSHTHTHTFVRTLSNMHVLCVSTHTHTHIHFLVILSSGWS